MPWPKDQGYDDYDSPPLVHEASHELGGQEFLCGNAEKVDEFLQLARTLSEPRIIAFWLREATFFANDGGIGMQRLARSWIGDADTLKRYIGERADLLIESGSIG